MERRGSKVGTLKEEIKEGLQRGIENAERGQRAHGQAGAWVSRLGASADQRAAQHVLHPE